MESGHEVILQVEAIEVAKAETSGGMSLLWLECGMCDHMVDIARKIDGLAVESIEWQGKVYMRKIWSFTLLLWIF